MGSNYEDDYQQRPRTDRPPYPPDDNYDSSRSRPKPSGGLPPPPMGDALPPALKREGSHNRVPADARPEFPEEASYLAGNAPDLERKNHPRDKRFRDKRDGYESDEGETLRSARPSGRNRPRDDGGHASEPDRRPRRRGEPSAPPYPRDDEPPRRRRDNYYEEDPPRRSKRRDSYYEDDAAPPRRRRDRAPEVEYGSDPIPVRRHSERRPPPRRRRDDYDDDSTDDDYGPRRRRSYEDDMRRRSRNDDGRDRYADRRDDRRGDRRDDRRRRDDGYDRDDRRRRDDRSRRRYSDDDDDEYSDRRRRRDRSRPPKEMKIGNFDVGPLVEQGQKHYSTLAPILTPIVLGLAKKYMGGKK